MKKKIFFLLSAIIFVCVVFPLHSQQLGELTVEKIMRDPVWIGSEPSSIRWAEDGSKLYFNWDPHYTGHDSLYAV